MPGDVIYGPIKSIFTRRLGPESPGAARGRALWSYEKIRVDFSTSKRRLIGFGFLHLADYRAVNGRFLVLPTVWCECRSVKVLMMDEGYYGIQPDL